MLSDTNIRKINSQIEDELRTVGSSWSSDETKTAAIKRIAQLKALLSEEPAAETTLEALAEAIVARMNTNTNNTPPTFVELLADAFRR